MAITGLYISIMQALEGPLPTIQTLQNRPCSNVPKIYVTSYHSKCSEIFKGLKTKLHFRPNKMPTNLTLMILV